MYTRREGQITRIILTLVFNYLSRFFLLQKYLEPSPWLQTNFPFKAFQHKLATDTAGPEGEYLPIFKVFFLHLL